MYVTKLLHSGVRAKRAGENLCYVAKMPTVEAPDQAKMLKARSEDGDWCVLVLGENRNGREKDRTRQNTETVPRPYQYTRSVSYGVSVSRRAPRSVVMSVVYVCKFYSCMALGGTLDIWGPAGARGPPIDA